MYTQNRKYPWIRLVCALIIGIVLYPGYENPVSQINLSVGLIFLFLILSNSRFPVVSGLGLLALVVFLGAIRMGISELQIHATSSLVKGEKEIYGKIIAVGERDAIVKTLQVDSMKHTSRIRVIADTTIDAEIGHWIYFRGFIDRIEPNRNPYNFNPRRFFATKGVYHHCFIKAGEVLVKDTDSKWLWQSLRQNLDKQIDSAFSGDCRLLAKTLLMGQRLPEDSKLISLFRATGHMHLLAISGLHLGILFLLIRRIVRPLRSHPISRWLSFAMILTVLWSFAFFTGGKPSALRAAFMFSMFALASTLYRKYDAFNILGFVAFVLLLVNPYLIWDVGFQLSFLAMTGIILLVRSSLVLYQPSNMVLRRCYQLILLSSSAVLFTMPVVLFYFDYVSISSIVYSPITITITSIVLPLLLVWTILSTISVVGGLIASLITWLTDLLVSTLTYFLDNFHFSLHAPSFHSIHLLVLFSIILILSGSILLKRRMMAITAVCFGLFFSILFQANGLLTSDRIDVVIYDEHAELTIDICHDDSCLTITNTEIESYAASGFRNHRNISTVKKVPEKYRNQYLFRQGNFFCVKNTTFAISDGIVDSQVFPHVDYLIVAYGVNRLSEPNQDLTDDLIIHRSNPYTSISSKRIHNMFLDHHWHLSL